MIDVFPAEQAALDVKWDYDGTGRTFVSYFRSVQALSYGCGGTHDSLVHCPAGSWYSTTLHGSYRTQSDFDIISHVAPAA